VWRATAWSGAVALGVVVPGNVLMRAAFGHLGGGADGLRAAAAVAGSVGLVLLAVRLGGRRAAARETLPDGTVWTVPSPCQRRTARTAAAVPLLGFSLPHWLWAAGLPVGTDQGAELAEISSWLWALGLVAAAGGALTLGLVRPWGQRVPLWVPVLGGRPVPALLAVVPAAVVAAALAQYGAMMTGCAGTVLARRAERCFAADRDYLISNWLFTATYPVFLLWGLLLAAAAVARWRLRPQSCARTEGPAVDRSDPTGGVHGSTVHSARPH
jgi:hypothetical protein